MATDSVFKKIPTSDIVVFDFPFLTNALVHSPPITRDDLHTNFAFAYGLTQLVSSPSRILNVEDQTLSLLDNLLII